MISICTPGDNPGLSGGSRQIENIVKETGGEVLDVNSKTSLISAFDAAITNLRLRYTLGFYPSHPGKDGSKHRLVVKLASKTVCPDCRIQARSGYHAGVPVSFQVQGESGDGDPAGASEETISTSRLWAAGANGSEGSDIQFKVHTAKSQDARSKPQIKIDLVIDLQKVDFVMAGGRHTARLRVTVFYGDSKGKLLGSDWKVVDMRLLDSTYRRLRSSGLSLTLFIPLEVPHPSLKIIVYDPGGDSMGSKVIKL